MHIFSFCIILVIWCWGGVVGLHSMRLSYLSLYRPFQIECNVSNPNVVMSSSSGGNLLFDGSWNNSQFPSLSYSGWLDWIVAGRFDSVQRLSRSNPKKRLLTRFLNLKTVKQSQYQIAGTQHDSLKFPIWINSRSPSSTPHWFSCNFSQQTQQKVLLMGLFHFISKLIQHILRIRRIWSFSSFRSIRILLGLGKKTIMMNCFVMNRTTALFSQICIHSYLHMQT